MLIIYSLKCTVSADIWFVLSFSCLGIYMFLYLCSCLGGAGKWIIQYVNTVIQLASQHSSTPTYEGRLRGTTTILLEKGEI